MSELAREPVATGQRREGDLLYVYTVGKPHLRRDGSSTGWWWVTCSSRGRRYVETLKRRSELEAMPVIRST